MSPKKRKKTKSKEEEYCPEEITEKERLETLGIFPDDEDDIEDDDESWRDFG